MPIIEFLYWTIIYIWSMQTAAEIEREFRSYGLERLLYVGHLLCSENRHYEASEVMEVWLSLTAAAPLMDDDCLFDKVEAATNQLTANISPDPIRARVHLGIADLYNQYVTRRGGKRMIEERDREIEVAHTLYENCNHAYGKFEIVFRREFEWGERSNLDELSRLAEKLDQAQFYGGQLRVLKFQERIALILKDRRARADIVQKIRLVSEKTGRFFSESQYAELETDNISGWFGKVIEGGEAALNSALEAKDPGSVATICHVLADAHSDDLEIREMYLRQMLTSANQGGYIPLASFTVGELVHTSLDIINATSPADEG